MIYLIIYIVGVIIASFIIPKVFPHREDRHKADNVGRVLIWPLLAVAFILLLPFAAVGYLIEGIFEMLG
jgi:TM2 domain-containing membrane protein YozV